MTLPTPDHDRDAGSPATIGRHRRLLLAVLTVTLTAPVVLFTLGIRGTPMENRPATAPPGLEPGRLLDTAYYHDIDDYGADVMPLRRAMVEADATLDLSMWLESPNPKVGIGDDGWLFLVESWRPGCRAGADVAAPTEQLLAVVRVLEASGRSTMLAVAPNKATAYPDKLGSLADQATCLEPIRARTRERLARAGRNHVDLFAMVEEMVADRHRAQGGGGDTEPPAPLYYPDDTHWTPALSMTAAGRLIDHFDSGLWDPSALVRSTEVRIGDLAQLIGLAAPTTHERLSVERSGPGPRRLDDNDRLGPNDWRAETTKPVLPGRTLVIHDSFLAPAEPSLAAYLDRSRFVDWTRADELVATDEGWLTAEMMDADRVVLQLVERNLYGRYGMVDDYPLPVTAEGLVTVLADDLASHLRPARDHAEGAGPDRGTAINIVEPNPGHDTYVVIDGEAHLLTEALAVAAGSEIYDIP